MFSQAKFGTVALKTIYLFGCLRGTLVVTKVLAGFFFSSESVSYPRGREDKYPCFHRKFTYYRGRFVFIPEVLGELFLTIIAIS